MNTEFETLAHRARLFIQFLDDNKIDNIFPDRVASKKELEGKINSGSLRKMKIFDNIINNLLIGKNGMSEDQQKAAMNFLAIKMGAEGISFFDKKIKLYSKIKTRGFIKSSLELNDAIEILNSQVLGLTIQDKIELKDIIAKSMLARI
jgi:hypothetical protein